ncbi:hypothetical protein GCM10007901_03610 [Dyella acidisoli]|uniref:Uncharacterized protein n=1 Tax=Dyella acidisoli TaxID=1867834 RepID=A0ABQ5XJP6_9GAMM|nr:hypothetical protein GCM10007901_03610 [Dyella acidisoli]
MAACVVCASDDVVKSMGDHHAIPAAKRTIARFPLITLLMQLVLLVVSMGNTPVLVCTSI